MRANEIAARLTARSEDFCRWLFPQGKRSGRDWCVGSLDGEPGNSLKICIDGHKAGRWADFGGTQADKGDLIGLLMRAKDCDLHQACEKAVEWLGLPPDTSPTPASKSPAPKKIETRAPSETWIRLQRKLRVGTQSELQQLADLRQIPFTAPLELATLAGQLWFGDVWDDGYEWPCWILTDAARRNAQARRLDGQPFVGIGNKKAKTIVGCEASWPVGITEAVRKPEIALVEGGPDFLAAWYFIWVTDRSREVGPVAMFGASQPIHPEALPLFRDKTVWVFPHEDENRAGLLGAIGWRDQLRKVPAKAVHFFDFSPNSVKDLNELATQHRVMEAAS